MNGGRGAKGSINDRLISLMYKNRYKKLQLQKESYIKSSKKEEKEFLKSIQYFDIDDDALYLDEKEQSFLQDVFAPLNDGIDTSELKRDGKQQDLNMITNNPNIYRIGDLHIMNEKMIEYDPETEEFDFDKFDYYELIQKRTGIGETSNSAIIDVKQEISKVDDEITIVEELEKFIDDSLELIDEIKIDLKEIEGLIEEQYTEEQIINLEEKYKKVKEKVDKLKKQYDIVKDKYDFENFDILNNIEMMLAIDNYKDKSSIEELETLVDYCKNEIDQIDGIVVEEKKSTGVSENIIDKKVEIKKRDDGFEVNKKGVIYLDELERIIAKESREQKRIMYSLEKKLANFTTEIVPVVETVYHTEKMFGSFLKIAAGILTAPFSGRKVFGTMLGAHLINKGVRGLRESLTPEFVNKDKIVHHYTSIEQEILNSKDYVNSTDCLLSDSIYQLDKFDEEFKNKYSDYVELIPEYKNVEKQIQELKLRLANKQLEINTMKNDLDRQYASNKVKVRKAS